MNSARPIRPRSSALRWLVYTSQPIATSSICTLTPIPRAQATAERSRAPPAPVPVVSPGWSSISTDPTREGGSDGKHALHSQGARHRRTRRGARPHRATVRSRSTCASPSEMGGPGGGTNPEELFAVGYAACFEGALGVVARRTKVEAGDVAIDSEVSLSPNGRAASCSSVALNVTLPGSRRPGARRRARARRARGVPVLKRHARQHRGRAHRQRRTRRVAGRPTAGAQIE